MISIIEGKATERQSYTIMIFRSLAKRIIRKGLSTFSFYKEIWWKCSTFSGLVVNPLLVSSTSHGLFLFSCSDSLGFFSNFFLYKTIPTLTTLRLCYLCSLLVDRNDSQGKWTKFTGSYLTSYCNKTLRYHLYVSTSYSASE